MNKYRTTEVTLLKYRKCKKRKKHKMRNDEDFQNEKENMKA